MIKVDENDLYQAFVACGLLYKAVAQEERMPSRQEREHCWLALSALGKILQKSGKLPKLKDDEWPTDMRQRWEALE